MPPIGVVTSVIALGLSSTFTQIQAPLEGIIATPSQRVFGGDSQTGGREFSIPSAVSHAVAFSNIWNENSLTPVTYSLVNGVSGRILSNTFATVTSGISGDSISGPVWFHFQESGGQSGTQSTAAGFATVLYDGILALATAYPGSVFTYETAFSFGREATAGRDWHPYNDELPAVVAALAIEGITLHIVPVCEIIEYFETQTSPVNVWFQAGHPQNYHFTGAGNFAIAMAIFKKLNYDITTLAHTSVLVDSGLKTLAIASVLEVMT